MNPKISVIIPVYQVEPYLNRCLDSVINQTLERLEIIIIASDSRDKSVDICRQYAGRYSHIRLVVTPPQGLSVARNTGLKLARGEYIAFVDSDDYILPEMFSLMYSFSASNRLDISMCSVLHEIGGSLSKDPWTDSKDILIRRPENARKDFLLSWNIAGKNASVWNKLYRHDFIESLSLEFDASTVSEDVIFNNIAFLNAQSVGSISEAYYVYVDRSDSLRYNADENKFERFFSLYWRYLTDHIKEDEHKNEMLAYSAVRMMASAIFTLKLSGRSVEEYCAYAYRLSEIMGLQKYLKLAETPLFFADFTNISGLKGNAAKSYLEFIISINQGYDAMVARQKKYHNEFGQVE